MEFKSRTVVLVDETIDGSNFQDIKMPQLDNSHYRNPPWLSTDLNLVKLISATLLVRSPARYAISIATGLLIVIGLMGSPLSMAEDGLSWPDKSGPTFDGRVAASDADGLPVTWNEASGENIAWKVPIKGTGHSTPVIGGGRIWLTSATDEGTKQYVTCIEAASGDVLHQRLIWENISPEPLGNQINTYASPSCVLESDAVYVHFGTYGTARLDPHTGKTIWSRRDINVRHFRGPGSSPILGGELLILTFDGIDQQFLIALNKNTGDTVWKTNRSTDYHDLDENGNPFRDGDKRKAYGTPSLTKISGRWQVISVGSRAGFGYDLLTGMEIWTLRHDDFNASARPICVNGHVYLNTGSGRANTVALRLDETAKGDVTSTHVSWDRDRGNSRLASPIIVEDRLFMVTDKGVIYCLEWRTGKEIFAGRIGGTHVASPIFANGNLYFCDERGVTSVVRASDEFEIVNRNQLDEGMRASFAAANGALYLRTFGHLYKIAK
ncbi:MAG: PQQ-binding-like beta-propeller repeat protein [Pirellulaceae bacterium]